MSSYLSMLDAILHCLALVKLASQTPLPVRLYSLHQTSHFLRNHHIEFEELIHRSALHTLTKPAHGYASTRVPLPPIHCEVLDYHDRSTTASLQHLLLVLARRHLEYTLAWETDHARLEARRLLS